MTGAEFAQKIWSGVVPDGSIDLLMVAREFDAAVTSLTAERDASSEDPRAVAVIKDLNTQVVELKSERDAARFEAQDRTQRYLKTRERQDALIVEVKKFTTERDACVLKYEAAWKELQAARADAAAYFQRADRAEADAATAEYPPDIDFSGVAPATREEREAWIRGALNDIGQQFDGFARAILALEASARSAENAGRAFIADVTRLREENKRIRELKRDAYVAEVALGRAHAALREAQHDIGLLTGQDDGIIKHQRLCAVYDMIRASLEDPTGRAAVGYVSALEVEHAEIERLGSNLHGFITLMAAHAAVEALRTVKP